MTVVIDIECPNCGRASPVRKEGLATYRCSECDSEFDQEEIAP